MSESEHTKKFHPTPARDHHQGKSQTDGASQAVSGTGNNPPSPNVIKENKKTKKGYEGIKKGQRNP
jgi:hypothetical protein